MAGFKTPQEKKRLSLAGDRRNTYGESDKGSRKAIRRNKQIGQRQLRRGVNLELKPASGVFTGEDAEDVAAGVAAAHSLKNKKRFRKFPDTPLGEVIAMQKERRAATYRAHVERREKCASETKSTS